MLVNVKYITTLPLAIFHGILSIACVCMHISESVHHLMRLLWCLWHELIGTDSLTLCMYHLNCIHICDYLLSFNIKNLMLSHWLVACYYIKWVIINQVAIILWSNMRPMLMNGTLIQIWVSCMYCIYAKHVSERAIQTLVMIGSAVFNGGLSTFLAFVLLGGSDSYLFTTFFKVNITGH